MNKPVSSGYFEEFLPDATKLIKSDETEGDASLRPDPVPVPDQTLPAVKQDVPAAPSGYFNEFLKPANDTPLENSDYYKEFKSDPGPQVTDYYTEFVQAENKDNPIGSILKSMGTLAKDVAMGQAPGAAAAKAYAKLDTTLLGEIDPINFKVTDFIPTPLRLMSTAGKLFQREEAAVAEPILATMRGEKPLADMLLGPVNFFGGKETLQGASGEAKSQYKEGELAQFGDIARDLNVPEPLAALFGLTAQAALPSSILLGNLDKMMPIAKLFTKAADMTTNTVARDIMISQFKDSSTSLDAIKKNIMSQIGDNLPPETVELFKKEVLNAQDKPRAISMYFRAEKKAAEKAALTGTETSALDRVGQNIKHAYMDTIQAPRVFDMMDGFQNYRGINARMGKALSAAETNASYQSRLLTHDFLEGVQDLGFNMIDADLEKRLTINAYARQGETQAVEQLLKAEGLTEMPKLTAQEGKILDLAESIINKDVDNLAAAYEKSTGKKFVKVQKYSLPLRYASEPTVNAKNLVERNYKWMPPTDQSKKFLERDPNFRVPRADFLNMFTQALHNQEWYKNMQPMLDRSRQILEHPIYAKGAEKDNLSYWGEYLSAVENRGSNAVATGFQGLLKQARLNLNSAVLGYRLSSILMQPFAIFDAMAYANTRFGPKVAADVLNEVARTWINPKYANTIIKGSKALTTRQGGELAIKESMEALQSTKLTQGIRKLIPSLAESKSLDTLDAGYRTFMNKGFQLLTEADVRTAAGVEKAFQKVLKKNGEKNWKQEADFLMNLVSASSEVTHRPLVLSRGEMNKLWFTFQTFVLNRWGLAAHDLIASGVIKAGKQREATLKAASKAFSNPDNFEQNIKTGQYAILSGERTEYSAVTNANRSKAMLTELRERGFHPIPVEGTYGGASEKSFLVPGMSEQEAHELGKKYNQESVLSPKGLIYSDRSGIHAADVANTTFNQEATDYFSKVKIGGKEIKFQIPVNFESKTPIEMTPLTQSLHDPNTAALKMRAIVGLGILGAGNIAENQARAGLYHLTTDKELKPQSYVQQVLSFLPEQIPYFGNIISAVGRNTSALPPVLKTVENLYRGVKSMTQGQKDSIRVKGALQAIQGTATLGLGIPGTSQLFDLLQRSVPKEHPKIHLSMSAKEKMVRALKKG